MKKNRNYVIMEPSTGRAYRLADGTYLRNQMVFAGKGTRKAYRIAKRYAEKFGGNIEDWQHVKGIGTVVTADGDRKAEIHWSQCQGIGKRDLFIKRWLD